MNDLINEGLVPHNFSWRAGIGTDVTNKALGNLDDYNPTTKGFNPLAPGSVNFGGLGVKGAPSPERAEKLAKQKQLLSEIDRIATEQCKNDKNYVHIKQTLLLEYTKLRKNYDSYLDADFYKWLYKICIMQYANAWCKICADAGENNFKSTEFIILNKEININPLLIYSLFTRTETGITDVSPIDNDTKMIHINNNIKGGSSKMQGFIEELDMVYNDVMNQKKPKELLKMELLSKLQSYKKKYSKYIIDEHGNIYNYCKTKPIEIGQFIYDIFYSENVRINESRI